MINSTARGGGVA